MHPNIKSLIELQKMDLRLAELRGAMAGFPGRVAEVEKRVADARACVTAAREAHTASLKDRKKYELDVEQWKEKVQKYKDQSYAVKSNEAYKALQHEIQNAETEVAGAEDRLLERMVSGEEFERQIKAAEGALKQEEAAAKNALQAIEAERAGIQKELDADSAEREKAVAAVPEDLLDHYHRIARRHHGVALAEVRDETCSLCRVRVRPHVYQELRRKDCEEIFHCESCTRILYCAEESAVQPAAEATGENGAHSADA